MDSQFIQLEKQRHSIYHLGRDVSLAPDEVADLIKKAVRHAPTPFNNQSVRAVILLNHYQDQVWQLISQAVKKVAGSEKYQKLFAPKLQSFHSGYGTVLFYTDESVVKKTAAQVASFPQQSFTEWAEQAQGNAQFSVWTALAEQKVGASIHHYSMLLGPTVADALAKAFQIPDNWHLRCEMVFGSIQKPAHQKPLIDDQKKFKVFK